MEFEKVITVKNRTVSDLLDEPFAAIDLVFVATTGELGNYPSTGR
jgi:hypothetical protein